MAFDFRQKLIDESGEIDGEAAGAFLQQLVDQFEASPEGDAPKAPEVFAGDLIGTFLDYELGHVKASLADQFRTVLGLTTIDPTRSQERLPRQDRPQPKSTQFRKKPDPRKRRAGNRVAPIASEIENSGRSLASFRTT